MPASASWLHSGTTLEAAVIEIRPPHKRSVGSISTPKEQLSITVESREVGWNRPHVHALYLGGTSWNKVFYQGVSNAAGAVYVYCLPSRKLQGTLGIGCSCLGLPTLVY